jgi:hypothetical protein
MLTATRSTNTSTSSSNTIKNPTTFTPIQDDDYDDHESLRTRLPNEEDSVGIPSQLPLFTSQIDVLVVAK